MKAPRGGAPRGRQARWLAVLAAALAVSAASAQDDSVQVEALSCTSGPYRIKLPQSYKAVRALARLKRERLLKTEDWGSYRAYHRELRFAGLELVLITFSNKPDQYLLSSAALSSPAWRIAGQFRVGNSARTALHGLLRDIPHEAEVELEGETDSVRLTVSGGRVEEVDYECYTG